MGISIRRAFDFGIFSDKELVATVVDLLIDPGAWMVRYLVAGYPVNGPAHRAILPLSALTLAPPGRFLAALSRDEIAASTVVDLDRGMTRKDEVAVHERYHWTPYWTEEAGEVTDARLLGAQRLFEARAEDLKGFTGRIVDLFVDFSDGQVEHLAMRSTMPPGAETFMIPPQAVASIQSSAPDPPGNGEDASSSEQVHGLAPLLIMLRTQSMRND